ncbi:MAG: PP2C family protein-serine/threonine phosphatase, partial [Planctomycetota bacterium]
YKRQAPPSSPREVCTLDNALVGMTASLRDSLDRQVTEAKAREAAEGELRVARQMQESLLPAAMTNGQLDALGVCVFGMNVPARAVAGDFYDHFLDVRGRLVVCVADVSGKGARAALLAAVARTALRAAADAADGPGELVAAVNAALLRTTRDTRGSFITMFVAHVEPGGRITYANAGHPPAAVVTAAGQVAPVGPPTGLIVGVADAPELNAHTAALELPDDWRHLVIVTDGFTEATPPGEDLHMLGEAGLHATLGETTDLKSEAVAAALTAAVERHEGPERSDDLTILVLSRPGSRSEGVL